MKKFACREIVYMFLVYISYIFTQKAIYGEFLGRSKYYIYILIILLGLIYLLRNAVIKKDLLYYFITTMAPYFFIFIYSIYQSFFGHIYDNTMTIILIYWMIPIITMLCGLYVFNINSVDLIHNAMVFSYGIVIVFYIIHGDKHISGDLSLGFSESLLEAGQITFSFGMMTIFYMFFDKRQKHSINKRAIISLCFSILGLKRIVYAALIVALFFAFLSKRYKWILNLRNIKVFAFIIFLSIYGYIYIVKSGIYTAIFDYLNIDTFGRTIVYDYFDQFFKLSIFYQGMGVGFCVKALAAPAVYLREIRDIHNDLLKMYIELGFLISFLYFMNLVLFQAKRIYKKLSKNAAKLYFILIVYTIVICTTDNILRYNDYIMILNLLPFIVYLQEKARKGRDSHYGTKISLSE